MNFKIGQKLIVVDDSNPTYPHIMPKKGTIVTYDGVGHTLGGIFLKEYTQKAVFQRACYWAWRFRPLINISAIDELINTQTVKETSDYPIQIPETA